MRAKRDKLLILLVALIVVIGIVDYFLFRQLGRERGPLPEREQVKQDTLTEEPSEFSRDKTSEPLEAEMETETDSIASSYSDHEKLSTKPQSVQPSPVEDHGSVQSSPVEEYETTETIETPTEARLEPTLEEEPSVTIEEAEPEGPIRPMIQRSAIALAVENREPKGVSAQVSVREEKVYCWLHIVDGKGEKITVRWLTDGHEISEARLSVGSDSWRTWSYITLTPDMVGPAQVHILRDGQLLETLSFEITE